MLEILMLLIERFIKLFPTNEIIFVFISVQKYYVMVIDIKSLFIFCTDLILYLSDLILYFKPTYLPR